MTPSDDYMTGEDRETKREEGKMVPRALDSILGQN